MKSLLAVTFDDDYLIRVFCTGFRRISRLLRQSEHSKRNDRMRER